jgi:hypothetical protein
MNDPAVLHMHVNFTWLGWPEKFREEKNEKKRNKKSERLERHKHDKAVIKALKKVKSEPLL